MADDLFDYETLSDYMDVSVPVLRKYLSNARTNRAAGINHPADMPEPDMVIGRSPAWWQSTVDEWLAARPGKGVGGGPKPKGLDRDSEPVAV